MQVKISGIVCPECSWRDDDVQFSEYPNYLNKTCPHCQYGNLLTDQEYKSCLIIYKAVNRYNKIANILKWVNPIYYYKLIKNKLCKN